MKRVELKTGDVFLAPLSDGRLIKGQILNDTKEFTGDIPCIFYGRAYQHREDIATHKLDDSDIILAVCVHDGMLTRGLWPIIGNHEVTLPPHRWPNARQRATGDWVGARFYDAGVVEDFLNAFFGLMPWDGMHDPLYFEKMLFNVERRPVSPIYSKSKKSP